MATEIVILWDFRDASPQLVEQMCAHLGRSTDLTFRSLPIGELTADDLGTGAFPLLVRCHSEQTLLVVRAMQKAGISYGYYLDDNFWELDPSTEAGRYWRSVPVRRRLATILGGADPILASTHPLKDYLDEHRDLSGSGHRVHQAESYIDLSLIPSLPPTAEGRAGVRGGFASNRTHDLLLILPDLLAALESRPELEFEVVGGDRELLPEHPRLRWFPYQRSYADYIQFQLERQWDFGLAPLSDAPSNLYKTNNKYREYGALGVPGIYQEAVAYAQVRDEATGLTAPGVRSWREAIEAYVDSAALRTRIRENARAVVEEQFSIRAVSSIWARHLVQAPTVGTRGAAFARALDGARTAAARGEGRVGALRSSLARDGFGSTARRVGRAVARRVRPGRSSRTD